MHIKRKEIGLKVVHFHVAYKPHKLTICMQLSLSAHIHAEVRFIEDLTLNGGVDP